MFTSSTFTQANMQGHYQTMCSTSTSKNALNHCVNNNPVKNCVNNASCPKQSNTNHFTFYDNKNTMYEKSTLMSHKLHDELELPRRELEATEALLSMHTPQYTKVPSPHKESTFITCNNLGMSNNNMNIGMTTSASNSTNAGTNGQYITTPSHEVSHYHLFESTNLNTAKSESIQNKTPFPSASILPLPNMQSPSLAVLPSQIEATASEYRNNYWFKKTNSSIIVDETLSHCNIYLFQLHGIFQFPFHDTLKNNMKLCIYEHSGEFFGPHLTAYKSRYLVTKALKQMRKQDGQEQMVEQSAPQKNQHIVDNLSSNTSEWRLKMQISINFNNKSDNIVQILGHFSQEKEDIPFVCVVLHCNGQMIYKSPVYKLL
jgi:hypothetical protein